MTTRSPVMNRRSLLLGTVFTAALASHGAMAQPKAGKKPNILLLLADDLGFSDIGPYGSEIPTPNLDALAAKGLRYTQFYNTARCSTSRASLLTGLYPHQAGIGALDNVVVEGSRGLTGKIDDRAVTLPEVLGPAGYYTGFAGKWHMGLNRGTPPWKRGFERSLTIPGGIYYKDQNEGQGKGPKAFIDGREVPLNSPEIGEDYWYVSDLLAQWSGKFIDEAKAANKPFFVYLPFTAPHFPVMAPEADVKRFKGKYLAGWEKLRQARFERQKKLGIIPVDTKLSDPLPEAYDWDKLPPEEQARFDEIMAVYAAAVTRVDRAIGTLVEKLRASGELDNTIILFLSDNGGNAESGPDGKSTGTKLGDAQSTVWVGLNWATLNNTPLPFFKHFTREGGISSPLVIHWPRGIDAKVNGTLVNAPSHLIDVLPTLVEIGGATYPKQFNGHDILPYEGRSFVPSFAGKALTRKNPIFFEHEGNRAVRDGDWKLVAGFEEPWQLYNIKADRSETNNLATAKPDQVARLSREYDLWAERAFVDPWPRKKVPGGVVKGKLADSAGVGGI
ncbi:MAG: arylsulfatase [Asticcacaulis sp.]